MKVKVPKRNRIGALSCKVRYQPFMRSDDSYEATLNKRTRLISIDTQLQGQQRDVAFNHEIIHQIDINYECGLTEDNISRLANGLYEFLHNNLKVDYDWSDIK